MKMKTAVFVVFVLTGILPYAGAATPGIDVTVNPLSITTASGTTIDYQVTITNQDDDFAKTITSLGMTVSQPTWTYTFDPSLTGVIIPAGIGSSVTTTLHVNIPSPMTSQVYSDQITAEATYDLFGIPASDSDPENFNTEITEITPIPEFPTIALPVISVLGLLLLMTRRKGRSS